MTPMTRGSVMDNTQRDDGFDFPSVLSRGVVYGKTQRNTGFEILSTMGRYIEAHFSERQSVAVQSRISVFQYGITV